MPAIRNTQLCCYSFVGAKKHIFFWKKLLIAFCSFFIPFFFSSFVCWPETLHSPLPHRRWFSVAHSENCSFFLSQKHMLRQRYHTLQLNFGFLFPSIFFCSLYRFTFPSINFSENFSVHGDNIRYCHWLRCATEKLLLLLNADFVFLLQVICIVFCSVCVYCVFFHKHHIFCCQENHVPKGSWKAGINGKKNHTE